MKTFEARPLIRNATPPSELFTADELGLIRDTVNRYELERRYGPPKTSKVTIEEKVVVGDLLRIARFHGYTPKGVNANKEIRWQVVLVPTTYPQCVITSIMACVECQCNFHAHHYPDEKPGTKCRDCSEVTKSKEVPDHLKRIPRGRPAMTMTEKERRIAYLRKQAEGMKP